MSDNLRTRIARILYSQNADEDWNGNEITWEETSKAYRECWLHDADVLIRELPELCPFCIPHNECGCMRTTPNADPLSAQRRVEWRAVFGYDGYAKCETHDEAKKQVDEFNAAPGRDIRDGEQAMVTYRYVTDWIASDESRADESELAEWTTDD